MSDTDIINAMQNYEFSVEVSNASDPHLVSSYVKRGFKVRQKSGNVVVIDWRNPDISINDLNGFTNTLTNNFSAAEVYLKITNNNDIRHLTPRIVKNMLLKRKVINDTYGISNKCITKLYHTIIKELVTDNHVVYLQNGVMSLRKLYEDDFVINTYPFPPIPDDNDDIGNDIFVNNSTNTGTYTDQVLEWQSTNW